MPRAAGRTRSSHEINDALITAFVTPIEREDIAMLSENLDTVTDRIEGVLHRLYFDNITEIRPDALELVAMIERACTEMCALLDDLPQFKRSKTLRTHVIAINDTEEGGRPRLHPRHAQAPHHRDRRPQGLWLA